MSNAMKKLKLLHHITASTSTTTTTALPAYPTSPPFQQQQQHHQRAQYQSLLHPQQQQPHYQTPRFPSYNPPKCQLPAGFMVLTPLAASEPPKNLQGLCIPSSPPMAIPQQPAHPTNTSIYSSRPPQSQHYQSRRKQPARLTCEAVSKIGKDSRLARWERVLGYVREQRRHVSPKEEEEKKKKKPLPTTPLSWKHSALLLDRKRRAEELEAIEAKNRMLDQIDREEMDMRSLWSGGSAGTNGVDEFVWSEDEDDDVLPMPQAPPPVKVIPEEGLFEMEEQKPSGGAGGGGVMAWGQRIVEEMPMLCREAEMEGGLARMVGRRMSAAY